MRRQWKMRWQSKNSCQPVSSRSIVACRTNAWTDLTSHRVNSVYCHRPKSGTWFVSIEVCVSNATYFDEMHFISCATLLDTHQKNTTQFTGAKRLFHVCCNGEKMETTRISKLNLVFVFIFTALNSFAQHFINVKEGNIHNMHLLRGKEWERVCKLIWLCAFFPWNLI